MGVTLVDHVLVHRRGGPDLFDELRATAAPPLPRAPRVGEVVAAPKQVREQGLVDLRRRLDEVAVRGHEGPPPVDAPDRVDPAGVDLATVVEELPTGTGVQIAPHLTLAAGLVGLGG